MTPIPLHPPAMFESFKEWLADLLLRLETNPTKTKESSWLPMGEKIAQIVGIAQHQNCSGAAATETFLCTLSLGMNRMLSPHGLATMALQWAPIPLQFFRATTPGLHRHYPWLVPLPNGAIFWQLRFNTGPMQTAHWPIAKPPEPPRPPQG